MNWHCVAFMLYKRQKIMPKKSESNKKPISQKQKDKIKNGKKLYDSIKGKSVFCPLLNAEVRFTNQGWRHLNNNKRNIYDILRRIDLFPFVDSVIKNPTDMSQSKTLDGCFILYGQRKVFKNSKSTKILIKVNVIKDRAGNYFFLSIC